MLMDAVRTASWTYIENRNVPFLSYNFNYRSLGKARLVPFDRHNLMPF
jgi:hypothetical protein